MRFALTSQQKVAWYGAMVVTSRAPDRANNRHCVHLLHCVFTTAAPVNLRHLKVLTLQLTLTLNVSFMCCFVEGKFISTHTVWCNIHSVNFMYVCNKVYFSRISKSSDPTVDVRRSGTATVLRAYIIPLHLPHSLVDALYTRHSYMWVL